MTFPRLLFSSFLFCAALLVCPAARAQFFIHEGGKLVGSGAVGAAEQGGSVALSADGNTALWGGPFDNGDVGAAWVFTRDTDGVWSQQGSKLVGSGAAGAAEQGWSVALSFDGNTALVSGPADNSNTGAAWVFTRDTNGVWSQQGSKLVGTGAIGPAKQGYWVALSGDGNTALVGGPLDNSNVGAVWVFTRDSNGNWSQQGSKLVGSGAVGEAEQGSSVALSADGNTALVGGPIDNVTQSGPAVGAVWVFTRDSNGNWSQQGSKLVGTGAVGPASQGISVALSADGNTALEGGSSDDESVGAVWVFTRDSQGNWTQQGNKLVGSGAIGAAVEGESVALSGDGDTALVAGALDNSGTGAMWVFTRDSQGNWSQQGSKIVNPGTAVALSRDGNTALEGELADDNGTGAVWPFIRGQQVQGQPPLVFIDVPGPETGPIVGYVKVSGWALDLTTTISQVVILLDGVPIGTTTLTDSRPDVCAVYPSSPDCPIVGWHFALDTTQYASGAHVIEARAISASGKAATVSASFTIANWTSGTGDPLLISIDTPNGSTTTSYMGTAAFGGWAIDKLAPISTVSVSVDNVFVGTASYGGARPDVCAVFANYPGCPNVGWNILVDTSLLTDGTHTLDVRATSAGGQNLTATSNFVVANFTSSNPLRVDIDTPNSSSGAFSGQVALGGWAVDLSSKTVNLIAKVQISIDGVSNGYATYGASRPDVCAALGLMYAASCPVGWNYRLDTTQIANGMHTLDVTAWSSDGLKGTVSTTFTVNNANTSGNPTKVFIDRPNGQASVLQGVAVASGWALNTTPGVYISAVHIYIDGSLIGDASYHEPRPDVCAVPLYSTSPDCPNVGWVFIDNTNNLANGTHTFAADAVSSDGTHTLASTTITVANWTTTGNPIIVNIDKPNSSSGDLSGSSVLVAGWAIDTAPGAAITSVTISVDGAPAGNATYGGNRADVCAIYTMVTGCPNVGWNFLLDTTVLADGSHTLDVTVMSSGGQSYTTTSSITILNNTSSNPLLVDIDTPTSGETLSGTAPIGGWAISTLCGPPYLAGACGLFATISSVTIYVDSALVGTASYGGSRPDVCATFKVPVGCPNVGWNFLLDTTLFENGTHRLDVVGTAISNTGSTMNATQSTSFMVNNP